jgi:2-polyprenyl-6-hydroxyphenyl methylase/3-demethylubiquinone-9 3-methyltransferase
LRKLINSINYCLTLGTHDWKKFIKPEELEKIIELENGKVLTKRGMVLQPTFNPGRLLTEGCASWKLSRSDLDVNYIVHCVNK